MNFPINPTIGQEYTIANKTWVFNSKGWEAKSSGSTGTSNYNDLTNKPSINNIQLSGDKSSLDLGLATAAQGAKADTALQSLPSGIVIDANYVHTDNNYSDSEKAEVANITNKVDKVIGSSLVPDTEITKLAEYPLFENLPLGGGGTNAAVYLTDTDSDIIGYKKLAYAPLATETVRTITANNNTVSGLAYLFDLPIDLNQFPAGTVELGVYDFVSNTSGTSNFIIDFFVRSSAGVEVAVGTITSASIEWTTRQVQTIVSSVYSAVNIDPLGRFGCRVKFSTTRTLNTTLSYVEGDGQALFFRLPIAMAHASIRRKNAEPEFQHVDTTEVKQELVGTEKVVIVDENGTVITTPKSNFATSGHTHDDRYYTTGQTDTLLSNKSDTGHTHNYLPLTGGTITGNTSVIGDLSGTTFYGDGSGLYNVPMTGVSTNNTITGVGTINDPLSVNFSSANLDKYIFTIELLTGTTDSIIVITNVETGLSFKHTPTDIPEFTGANEMFVEGNTIWIIYKWNSDAGTITNRIVRLENVIVNDANNEFYYNVAQIKVLSSGGVNMVNIHGTDMSETHIFGACRLSPTRICRINKWDFNDLEVVQLPSGYNGGETLKYYDGFVYLHVTANNYTERLKIAKINANDLTSYSLIVNKTSGNLCIPSPIFIHKGTIVLTETWGNTNYIYKYSLNGTLILSRQFVTNAGTGSMSHGGVIIGDYLYLTFSYGTLRIGKIRLSDLTMVSSNTTLVTNFTDDICVGKDGYIYGATEYLVYPPWTGVAQLYKIKPSDLSYTVFNIYDTGSTVYTTSSSYSLSLEKLNALNLSNWDGVMYSNATVYGQITSTKFITSGGTSTQFVKGDGTLDNNSYSTTAHTHNYLPLTGGTLTGELTGTTFIKSGGSSTQFLKADGSVDSNSYSTTGHTHDDRYYTESEVNTLLNGKSDTSHLHTGVYSSLSMNVLTAGAGATEYVLLRNIQTNILNTLPSGVNSTITLPVSVAGELNESVLHFNTGANLPTLVYSGFTPIWLNGTSISMKINKSYTIVFEQIRTATSTWIVKASWGEY